MALHVFGYGSLLYQPPAPEWLLEVRPARLPGYVRAFNKRSHPRACLHADALLPSPLAGWCTPDQRVSLALGTQSGPGGILGQVLSWPDEHATAVLAELDIREGAHGNPEDGYLRRLVTVELAGGHETVTTYLTNEAGPLFVGDLGVEDTARVLAHATPREPGERALGADYLAGAVSVVRALGGEDLGLEALARAVQAWLPKGRWKRGLAKFGVGA